MLDVEDWAEIRRLRKAEDMPIKVIARVLGCSKNTVKKALAADGPPAYCRPARGSVVDAVEPRIRELLQATPTMPATVTRNVWSGRTRCGCCGTGSEVVLADLPGQIRGARRRVGRQIHRG